MAIRKKADADEDIWKGLDGPPEPELIFEDEVNLPKVESGAGRISEVENESEDGEHYETGDDDDDDNDNYDDDNDPDDQDNEEEVIISEHDDDELTDMALDMISDGDLGGAIKLIKEARADGRYISAAEAALALRTPPPSDPRLASLDRKAKELMKNFGR